MPNFSDGFSEYLPVSSDRIRAAVTTGLIVLDTNVLLDAYRYTASARQELFHALRALTSRLWIPHQVALEFHRNRATVIASHGDAYSDAAQALKTFRRQYEDGLATQIREFVNRLALSQQDRQTLLTPVDRAISELQAEIDELRARHGVSERFITNDPVLRELQSLLANRVGDPLTAEIEAEVRQEAQRRITEEVPPGFKDSGKSDPCGDHLLWHQSLIEAKKRGVPMILVTRDNKSDWFLRMKGKMISALPALIAEAKEVANVDFIAMPTRTFLIQAKAFLKTQVSEATLQQSEVIARNKDKDELQPLHLTREQAQFAWNQISRTCSVYQERIIMEHDHINSLEKSISANPREDRLHLILAQARGHLAALEAAREPYLLAETLLRPMHNSQMGGISIRSHRNVNRIIQANLPEVQEKTEIEASQIRPNKIAISHETR